MTQPERGECPRCGKHIAIRANGTLRQHLKPNRNMRYRVPECPGSGKPPVN